jgi:hypothetical protein
MTRYLAIFAFVLCTFPTAVPLQAQERPANPGQVPPGVTGQPAPPALAGPAPGPRDYGEIDRLRQENAELRRQNALLWKKIQILEGKSAERGNAGTTKR